MLNTSSLSVAVICTTNVPVAIFSATVALYVDCDNIGLLSLTSVTLMVTVAWSPTGKDEEAWKLQKVNIFHYYITVFPRSHAPNKNHADKSLDGGRTCLVERAVKRRPACSKRRTDPFAKK